LPVAGDLKLFQLYLPFLVTQENGALSSVESFCTAISGKPIAFTSVEGVRNYIAVARNLLSLDLQWGVATELEFPGLCETDLEIDPLTLNFESVNLGEDRCFA
jgi:hypothetical protein